MLLKVFAYIWAIDLKWNSDSFDNGRITNSRELRKSRGLYASSGENHFM